MHIIKCIALTQIKKIKPTLMLNQWHQRIQLVMTEKVNFVCAYFNLSDFKYLGSLNV